MLQFEQYCVGFLCRVSPMREIITEFRYGVTSDIARRMQQGQDLAFLRSQTLLGLNVTLQDRSEWGLRTFTPGEARYWVDYSSGGKLGPGVFKTWDSHADCFVATKIKSTDGYEDGSVVHGKHYTWSQFMKEIWSTPGVLVPRVHDIGVISDGVEDFDAVVMEYFDPVSAPTLEQLLDQRGKLTPMETHTILTPVAQTIDVINTKHAVAHQDVKERNIFVSHAKGVLSDFDIAKPIAADSTEVAYIDIRSLAELAYKCLTGWGYYTRERESRFDLVDDLYGPVVAKQLQKVCEKAIGSDQQRYYFRAGKLLEDVASACGI